MSSGRKHYDRGNLFDNMDTSDFMENISPDETVYFGVSSLRDYAEVLLKDVYFEEVPQAPDYINELYDSPSVFLGVNGAAVVAEEGSDNRLEVTYLGISEEDMAAINREGAAGMMGKGREVNLFDDITHSDSLKTREGVEDYVAFVEDKDLGLIE